jgi:lipopolysaccharide export system permease protein
MGNGGSEFDAWAGNDRVAGGTGDDTIFGGDGKDVLTGGAGNDVLNGGAGNDVLDGRAGIDTVSYADDTAGVVVNLVSRTALGDDSGRDTVKNFENVVGGSGNDSITGLPLDKKNLSVTKTEVSKRYSFSLACITFALIGIPLAITAQRRETTIGFVLSLVTAVVYITLIMVADSLNEKRSLYPHLLMWLPNVLFLSIGGTLFYKLSKK